LEQYEDSINVIFYALEFGLLATTKRECKSRENASNFLSSWNQKNLIQRKNKIKWKVKVVKTLNK
jgi:hypothetical protein